MKKYRVILTDAERSYLESQLNGGKFSNTRLRRAQYLLGSDQSEAGKNMTDEQMYQAYGGSIRSIENTRRRFVTEGFELALHGKVRPVNTKRKIDGRAESRLIALRCGDPPAGAARWSLRLLADKMVELGYVESISHQGINDVLKKHQLSLGRSDPG